MIRVLSSEFQVRAGGKLKTRNSKTSLPSPSLRFSVFGQKQIHELAAAVVKTLWLASRVLSEGISRNDRQCHRQTKVAYNRIGQAIGIDFAPRDRLCRRVPGKSAGIRSRIRNLQEIVVT